MTSGCPMDPSRSRGVVFLIAVLLHRYQLESRRRALAEHRPDWGRVGSVGENGHGTRRPLIRNGQLQLFGRGSVYQMANRCGLSGVVGWLVADRRYCHVDVESGGERRRN